MVGDCNATPSWPLYRKLARDFDDAAVVCAEREGSRAKPTWGPSAESRRLFRIDHAFVRDLHVENFHVVDIPGSDHSGLVFDVRPE